MSKAIKKPEPAALATVSEEVAALRRQSIQTVDSDSMVIPVVHLFQGTGKERQRLGDHQIGAYIDEVSCEPLPEGTRVIPTVIHAYYAVWDRRKGAPMNGPLATWERGESPPAESWDGTPIAYGTEAGSTEESIDIYWMIEGRVLPLNLRLGRSKLKAGKRLATMEAERVGLNRPAGAYILEAGDAQSKSGEPYKVPIFRPAGDATEDEMMRWLEVAQLVSSGRAKTSDDPTIKPVANTAGTTEEEPPF